MFIVLILECIFLISICRHLEESHQSQWTSNNQILKNMEDTRNFDEQHLNHSISSLSQQVYSIFIQYFFSCNLIKLLQTIKSEDYFNKILLQCSVPKGNLHCQCILSIFLASMHQFYANKLAVVNINQLHYINGKMKQAWKAFQTLIALPGFLSIF